MGGGGEAKGGSISLLLVTATRVMRLELGESGTVLAGDTRHERLLPSHACNIHLRLIYLEALLTFIG